MKLLPATVAIWCISLPALGAGNCLHYEGEPLTLTGKVTLQTFYGPPNYGESPETDSHETQDILVLESPICVDANSANYEEREINQRNITLVMPLGVNLDAYTGKIVTFKGTLFHAQTGHHHTPVLMHVININGTVN